MLFCEALLHFVLVAYDWFKFFIVFEKYKVCEVHGCGVGVCDMNVCGYLYYMHILVCIAWVLLILLSSNAWFCYCLLLWCLLSECIALRVFVGAFDIVVSCIWFCASCSVVEFLMFVMNNCFVWQVVFVKCGVLLFD